MDGPKQKRPPRQKRKSTERFVRRPMGSPRIISTKSVASVALYSRASGKRRAERFSYAIVMIVASFSHRRFDFRLTMSHNGNSESAAGAFGLSNWIGE